MDLYKIKYEIMQCMEEVDEETGELLNAEKLDNLLMQKDVKIENIACWIKNLKAEATALKVEKEALAERQKAAENKAEQLKKYLSNVLAGEKFSSAKVKISFRKSKSVEVDDWTKLDEEFLKYKNPDVNKTAVKKALENGQALNGVRLVERRNIQIK